MAGCCSTSSAESSFAKRLEPVASAGSPRPHTRTYQWDAGRVRPPLGRVAHLLLPCLWQVNFCATRRTTACGNAAAQDQQLRPAAMGRDRPGRLNSVLSVSCQKRPVRSTALLQLHHAGAVGRFTLFSAEVASSWSAPRLLKSSLFRYMSDSGRNQETCQNCRCVRQASHLRSLGTSGS